jgi:hypothetical protein
LKFFSVPNFVRLEATVVEEPWALPAMVWPEGSTKESMTALCANAELKHHFISTFEGVTGSIKIGKDASNPPYQMWGLIADYDVPVKEESFAALVAKPPREFPPAWGVTTFRNHARLVWLFEAPIRIANPSQLTKLLPLLAKRLGLDAWLPGLDTKALTNPSQYYELGRKWIPMTPSARVPKATLDLWTFEASKHVSLFGPTDKRYDIPFEAVQAEVEARFPGRWRGQFVVGARGIRFWDPTADNPTAAIVTDDGMMCFTGDRPFMSWDKIFGREWAEKFEADRISKAIRMVLWDEKYFWVNTAPETDTWERMQSGQFTKWLKCLGFSTQVPKTETASPADRIEMKIVSDRRVRGAMPFIYRKHGVVPYKGELVLNTSTIKVLAPAEAGIFTTFEDARTKWFPFIWSYLSNFLALVDDRPVQFEYLLGWMKHFYEGGYYQRPQPGHALTLVGDTGKGKTFFAQVLLSKLMGGSNDAADYIVRGSAWSDQLAKWPIAVIDDQQASSDFQGHQKFSAMVKKLVANQTLSFNGKWMATGEVEWNGRLVICCNADPESIRLIPNLDHSIADKISILRANDESPFRFPADRAEIARILDAELPAFARFLLEMPYPEHLVNQRDARYFLVPFKHPECYQTASRGGQAYAAHELLAAFLDEYAVRFPDKAFWEGTATILFKDLTELHGGATMGKMTPRSLGTCLGMLMNRGVNIKAMGFDERGVQRWRIPVALEWRDPDNVVEQLCSESGQSSAALFRKKVL